MDDLNEENEIHIVANEQRSVTALLRKIFLTESFLEKITFLFLTTLVSGIFVPYIMNLKAKREIKLQAQEKLLEDVSETLMRYETLALDVSFYKSYPPTKLKVDAASKEEINLYIKSYDDAVARYLKEIVDIFIQLRVQVIKANSLASSGVSKKLYYFHKNVLKDQDFRISSLLAKNATQQEWIDLHGYNRKILARATLLISDIATDFSINENKDRPQVDSSFAP